MFFSSIIYLVLQCVGVAFKSSDIYNFLLKRGIFFHQGLVQEVTGKMSDVQQLTQVGRELVDLSETGQLENLEDRLTRINNAWEDLSSAAEQRMLTLPKYKAKLADFEKSVDQMNQWLEDMEKETNKVHPKEEEVDLAKNKIDVSVYWILALTL